MYINNHAGECCGIRDIEDFESRYRRGPLERHLDESMANEVEEVLDGLRVDGEEPPENGSILFTAVLTDQQLTNNEDLVRLLKKKGFTLVNRFRNLNSGNICNVFHYTQRKSLSRRKKDLPFNW